MKKIAVVAIGSMLLIISIGAILVQGDSIQEIVVQLKEYGPATDITNDGEINVDDVSSLVSRYGDMGVPGWIRDDINRNGEVDVDDVSLLVEDYGLDWLS